MKLYDFAINIEGDVIVKDNISEQELYNGEVALLPLYLIYSDVKRIKGESDKVVVFI